MASASTPAPMSSTARPDPRFGICQIIGLVCIFGFLLNILVLLLPPQFGNPTWRTAFLQTFSDRSLVFLFGAALIMVGSLNSQRPPKLFSLFCLFVGGLFLVTCVLVVSDTLTLRQQALTNISNQENQIQTQIRNAQSNPGAVGKNITTEDLERASKMLSGQAVQVKQNAQTTVLKTGLTSIINLVVVGLGLIGLGRYGLSTRRR
jgi:hypothetical protein